MGFFSNKVERDQIKAGDHIYTWRTAYTYSHHGIYVGENKVVHFTNQRGLCGFSVCSFSSHHPSSTTAQYQSICPKDFPKCGSKQPKSEVVLSCLDCFLGDGSLYCFEYGVTKSIFLAKRPGTCTMATSDPITEDVIHRAMYLYDKGFGNYHVLGNNCEDFALYCKTSLVSDKRPELGTSGQTSLNRANVAALLSAPVAVIGSLWIPGGIPVSVATVGIWYCKNRYNNDLGVRTDVSKVSAEEMAVNFGWVGPLEEETETSDRQSPPNHQLGTSSDVEQQTYRSEWDPSQPTFIMTQSEQPEENLQSNTVPSAPLYTQPNQEFDVEGGNSRDAELNWIIQRVLSDLSSMTTPVQQPMPVQQDYSINACIEGLDNIEGLQQGGEMYLWAVTNLLMEKKEAREVFISIKNNATRLKWLEYMKAQYDAKTSSN